MISKQKKEIRILKVIVGILVITGIALSGISQSFPEWRKLWNNYANT